MNVKDSALLTLLVVVVFVFFFLIIFGDQGLVDVYRLSQEKERIDKENERLKEENLALYRTIARLHNDPAYVEQVARRELGMVGPDEIIYQYSRKAAPKEKSQGGRP